MFCLLIMAKIKSIIEDWCTLFSKIEEKYKNSGILTITMRIDLINKQLAIVNIWLGLKSQVENRTTINVTFLPEGKKIQTPPMEYKKKKKKR